MVNTLVSICIPTYQRPEMLKRAIESGLAQTYSDIEVVVSDDSRDDASEVMVRDHFANTSVRYFRNASSLGQAGNVNRLFGLAQGGRMVLLHDDDLLLPDAVQKLAHCWESDPGITVAFGKQYLMDAEGQVLAQDSEGLNVAYHRLPERAGRQQSAAWSALVAQFPNDGYMILTDAARTTLYRDDPEVGDACDYDFGLRLAAQYDGFYYLDDFTASYRLSPVSVSNNNNYSNLTYNLVASLSLPVELEPVRAAQLRCHAASAIGKWLRLGKKREAFRIFRSPHYPLAQRLTPRGMTYGLLLACPNKVVQSILKS